MEFVTSKAEISRRKKVFSVFMFSLFVGLIIASIVLNFPITILGYTFFAAAFLLIGALTFRIFGTPAVLKTSLTEDALIKITRNSSETFMLASISQITLKRTTRNSIREIHIRFNDGRSTFINALDDFDKFNDQLQGKIDKTIFVEVKKEMLDFDNVIFYPVLGLVLGFIGVSTMKALIDQSPGSTKNIFIMLAIYILAVASYIFLAKPISSRRGDNSHKTDNLLAGVFFCGAALVFLAGIFGNN